MKFLKSYGGALTICALVVVVSILFGFHRSATAARNEVERLFYEGADDLGGSIQGDLDTCLNITANLATVAGRYLAADELEPLEQSRAALAEAEGIAQAGEAYVRLMEEAEVVFRRLEDGTVSQTDGDYLQSFQVDLAARADAIGRDGYHAQAEAFNDQVLGRFPANILKGVTFVRRAEAFQWGGAQ